MGGEMQYYPRCDNCRWVCETHPERPWDGPRACGCGAAGAPCPVCNQGDDETAPEPPDGFVVETVRGDTNEN
jgi:hypothetical protein